MVCYVIHSLIQSQCLDWTQTVLHSQTVVLKESQWSSWREDNNYPSWETSFTLPYCKVPCTVNQLFWKRVSGVVDCPYWVKSFTLQYCKVPCIIKQLFWKESQWSSCQEHNNCPSWETSFTWPYCKEPCTVKQLFWKRVSGPQDLTFHLDRY